MRDGECQYVSYQGESVPKAIGKNLLGRGNNMIEKIKAEDFDLCTSCKLVDKYNELVDKINDVLEYIENSLEASPEGDDRQLYDDILDREYNYIYWKLTGKKQ